MKTITILEETFEISEPYAEGHTITAIEAKVLNQVRGENIGNNFRARVKAAKEGKEGATPLADLVKEMKEYDASYEFSLGAARGTRASLSPLEKECQRLARERVKQALKDAGKTIKDYGKEAYDSKVAEVMENETIQKMAADNLKRAEKQPELEIAV